MSFHKICFEGGSDNPQGGSQTQNNPQKETSVKGHEKEFV